MNFHGFPHQLVNCLFVVVKTVRVPLYNVDWLWLQVQLCVSTVNQRSRRSIRRRSLTSTSWRRSSHGCGPSVRGVRGAYTRTSCVLGRLEIKMSCIWYKIGQSLNVILMLVAEAQQHNGECCCIDQLYWHFEKGG